LRELVEPQSADKVTLDKPAITVSRGSGLVNSDTVTAPDGTKRAQLIYCPHGSSRSCCGGRKAQHDSEDALNTVIQTSKTIGAEVGPQHSSMDNAAAARTLMNRLDFMGTNPNRKTDVNLRDVLASYDANGFDVKRTSAIPTKNELR
jgi:hypothetical protein